MATIELPYEKVESLINEVSFGGKLVSIDGSRGISSRLIFLMHCTGMDKMVADFEYQKSYDKAIREGFLTSDATREILIRKGIMVNADDEVEKLESKIKAQEAYLSKLTRVPARRQATIDNIEALRLELEDKLREREVGLEYSADKIAFENKYLYMAWCGARDPFTKERIWPTREEFNKETDLVFRRGLFLEAIKLSGGMAVGTLRYLARNNAWRIRYLTAVKTGESLFGKGIPDYTVDQLSLAYWSHYYQSIYEMMPEDRPHEQIIEDDAALDAYMKSYMEDLHRENTSARESKHKGQGVKSAWDHGETLVMRSHPLYNDIEYSETIESVRNKDKTSISDKGPGSKKR